ncbi:MAG: hypothetical protein U5J83_17845 [Bryobacterales bacterium]|nr:hypothetical protein [Bryobacterales bacterium]
MRWFLAFFLLLPMLGFGQRQGPLPSRVPGARQAPSLGGVPSRAVGAFAPDRRPLLEQADLVVVARTVGGTLNPEQTAVSFDLRVQVQRVLKGESVTPGQELHLVFYDEMPRFPLKTSQPVTVSRGIVFLKRRGEVFEALRIPVAPRPSGNFLLHLPEGVASTETSGDVQTQIGLELAAALEYWGVNHAQALDTAGESGMYAAGKVSAEAVYFEQAASYFNGPVVDPAPFAAIYPQFLRSASPHVRLVGILGLIRLQHPMGINALARDFPLYVRSINAGMIADAIRRWDISKQPATVDTLGQMALSEEAGAGLETALAWGMGQHVLVDALPYLAALLESPHPGSRAGALMGICNLNEGGDPRASLWRYSGEEARPHCPNRFPVTDAQAERAHIAFWRNWWDTNRERIERDFRGDGTGGIVPFARAVAPARWSDSRQPASTMSQASPLQAARIMLQMFDAEMQRDPTQSPERPSSESRLRGMLGIEADEADMRILAEELERGAVALRAVNEQLRSAMGEARLRGERPDPAVVQAAETGSAATVEAFLKTCEQRLSPGVWRAFSARIEQRAKDTIRVTLPTPGRRP